MKQIFFLTCYHLCFWGFLGFLATLLFGFIAYAAGLSINIFYGSLIVFAILGVTLSMICVFRRCRKQQELQ